ncbi:hypothetical protein HAHE_34350 [Haloferula helveola]|uniref:DUF4352 domain-containing protein n=1 Tax=Haloferula helveola TaxID=490095 RepID=A0ABM7RGW8_9BACT|nr:hypothetical protein HAHE_34350 [Haloferula helveola]
MRTFSALALSAIAAALPCTAIETAKPLVSISVKQQTLTADHDRNGRFGDRSEKTVTLRVEIRNSSRSQLEDVKLSGIALVVREGERSETVRRHELAAVELPAMKPNEKVTVDLGKIVLSEYEWGGSKTEESLEEWKVVCMQGDKEVGSEVTEEYSILAVEQAKQEEPERRRFDPTDFRDRFNRRR